MFEVEVKVLLEKKERIKEKLISMGGKYIYSLRHEDTYFNMPKKLRNFYRTDEALRIRKSIEYDSNDIENQKIFEFLTYKGPKVDDLTKTRNEIEFEVEDGEKLKEILKILGFREVYTIKKERELFEIEYYSEKFEILFDYLPVLNQNFMEIECQTEKKNKISLKREKIFKFLRNFDISKDQSIRKSYLELVLEKLFK